jgi:ADP-ribose pyrophosphatase YjhB (NUDIX family)
MSSAWLPDDGWERVQKLVPIACVDALAVRFDRAQPGRIESIGLILREAPGDGLKWCLAGGRIRIGESIAEALARHVHETLGNEVGLKTIPGGEPVYVAQYFPTPRPGFGVDPRKHAIALTYVVTLTGRIEPHGEAVEFRWFAVDGQPTREEWGFGQDAVARDCLERLALATLSRSGSLASSRPGARRGARSP